MAAIEASKKSFPADLCSPRTRATIMKKPFQPISPVTKLDGHELRRLNGPMLI